MARIGKYKSACAAVAGINAKCCEEALPDSEVHQICRGDIEPWPMQSREREADGPAKLGGGQATARAERRKPFELMGIHDIEARVRGRATAVTDAVTGEALGFTHEGEYTVFTVPRLDIHAIAAVDLA